MDTIFVKCCPQTLSNYLLITVHLGKLSGDSVAQVPNKNKPIRLQVFTFVLIKRTC
jgi:hypothetical protein